MFELALLWPGLECEAPDVVWPTYMDDVDVADVGTTVERN